METRINTKSGKLLTVYDDLCPVSLINDIFYKLRSQEYPLVPSNDTLLQDFKGVNGFGKTVDVEFIRSILDSIKSPESFTLKRIFNRGKIEKSLIYLIEIAQLIDIMQIHIQMTVLILVYCIMQIQNGIWNGMVEQSLELMI